MRTHFNFYAPQDWSAAAELLQQYGSDARVMAGGTVLMIDLKEGRSAAKHVISLENIADADTLSINGAVSIGASTTFRHLADNAFLAENYTALTQAARQIGSVQIRNVATLAGNICCASPASDAVLPLLCFDAEITLLSNQGQRQLSIDDVILSRGVTALREDELLKEITIPTIPEHSASAFRKLGRRQAMEISFVAAAASISLDADGKVEKARIAMGAVAPKPMRAKSAEAMLIGEPLTPQLIEAAADAAAQAATPIDDVRASATYRRHLAKVLVKRTLEDCQQQLSE